MAEAGIAVLEGWVRDVMLSSTGNLDLMMQTRPHVLTAEQMVTTAARLDAGLSQRRRAVQRPTVRLQSAKQRSGSPSVLKCLTGVLMLLLIVAVLITGLATPALT